MGVRGWVVYGFILIWGVYSGGEFFYSYGGVFFMLVVVLVFE